MVLDLMEINVKPIVFCLLLAQKLPPPHQWAMASSFTRFLDHNDAQQSVGLLWMSDQLDAETSDNTQHSQQTDIHAHGGIRTHNLSRRAAADRATTGTGLKILSN